jgi:hypothetical protein
LPCPGHCYGHCCRNLSDVLRVSAAHQISFCSNWQNRGQGKAGIGRGFVARTAILTQTACVPELVLQCYYCNEYSCAHLLLLPHLIRLLSQAAYWLGALYGRLPHVVTQATQAPCPVHLQTSLSSFRWTRQGSWGGLCYMTIRCAQIGLTGHIRMHQQQVRWGLAARLNCSSRIPAASTSCSCTVLWKVSPTM